MSAADDILFAPIVTNAPWRALVDDFNAYLGSSTVPRVRERYPLDRQRPQGALLLMGMMESYYLRGHTHFHVVTAERPKSIVEFDFDGRLYFGKYEAGEYPCLAKKTDWSIRDLNLYRNTYNETFVFQNREAALAYHATL